MTKQLFHVLNPTRMAYLKGLVATVVLCLAVQTATWAQDPPMKWGEIPEEELHMTAYAPDTNASVVILGDYGKTHFQDINTVVFERHVRIKILREGGYDWGTITLPFHKDDQRVRGIKGQTFTVDAEGKVEKHELGKKSIFKEDVDDTWRRMKFTLPALQPGAVIEYRYRHEFNSPVYLPDWRFQTTEPVLWSEYRVEIPNRLRYASAYTRSQPYAIEESEKVTRPYGDAMLHRWALKEVPALRLEPYMTTPRDYQASISFQLAAYFHMGMGSFVDILHTWEETADLLLDLPSFGNQLQGNRAVRRQAEEVVQGLADPKERMIALYDFVRTTIDFNGTLGITADQDLDDVLKTRSGSSPDLALLLVALLREAGIEAHPVLISTRHNGKVIRQYPIVDQFNDVLACALIGGQEYLLEPTDKNRPYDLLSVSSLNGSGWLVEKDNPRWITIEAAGRYQRDVTVEATVDAVGTLTGTVKATNTQYAALDQRHDLEEAEKKEDFIRDYLLGDLGEVIVEDFAIENSDVMEPFVEEATITVPAYAQAAGDFLYLNPIVTDRMGENPLKLPERTFPIDFARRVNETYTLHLTLPEGYVLEEPLLNKRTDLPLDGGYYVRTVQEEEGILIIKTIFRIDKAVFPAHAYGDLQTFYEKMVAFQAEPIVLRRASEAPATAGDGE